MSPTLRAVALYARCWRSSLHERFASSGFALEVVGGLRWRVGLVPGARVLTQGTTRTANELDLVKSLVEADAFLRGSKGVARTWKEGRP